MRRRWLSCWLVLQLALPLQAATEPMGSPGAPGTTERVPARLVLPAEREPSTRAPEPTGLPGIPATTDQAPSRVVLPVEDASGASAPVIRRTGEGRGSLLDRSLAPQTWRGIKQPAADQPPLREWLVFSRNLAEAQDQRQALQPFALSILRRQQLSGLGRVISVYRIPDDIDLQQLEARLRQQFPDWQQELNLRHLPLGEVTEEADTELHRWGQRAIGQAQSAPANCGAGLALAMLDGPVNPDLVEFAGAELSYQSLVGEPFRPRSQVAERHGNGIAALLVGRQQVAGLLPAASLYALGVFGEDAEVGLHARTDWLLSGLDQVLALPAPVRVVNLSFGGGYSRLLESSFQRLQSRLQFVAAAGNDGVDGVRYPAAYPGVIAVGAVDARLQRLRQSNYGSRLSLVAPGEDIWTLDEQGQGYFASGTSLAAPFASAALVLAGSLEQLREQAKDIGHAGAGLVQISGCR